MRTRHRSRAAATPSSGTTRSAWSPAALPRAARRTRGAWCGRRSRAETDRSRGSRSRRRLPVALELAEQRADLRRLEGVTPVARVVEEAAPGLGAELVVRHLLLDEARGLEAVVAERLAHVAARAIQDVHTAPVDELEDSDRGVARSEERRVGEEGRS